MTSPRQSSGVDRIRESVQTSGYLWTASLLLDRAGLGILGLWPRRGIAGDRLSAQVQSILRAWGMSDEHIATTIGHLLYADIHGIDSHGCGMLLSYHRSLLRGDVTMTPVIAVVRESDTTALIDGGGGLGHVPADLAMKLAIGKARSAGLAAVAVRNSGHYGAAGAYAAMASAAGLIGIATTNTVEPAVVPTFGNQAMFGTNPIALSAPAARNRPFLLDMATSTVPLGKLMTAWRGGRSIPVGWALNRHGEPETNPRKAAFGRRLTPLGSTREMGSHKGYGLGVAVEILCSVLPGLNQAAAPAHDPGRAGHFFLAIDPRRFREAMGFESALDDLLDSLRATPPVRPSQPVLVAGDPEYAAAKESAAAGIALPRMVVEDMRGICRASGVPFILDQVDHPARA